MSSPVGTSRVCFAKRTASCFTPEQTDFRRRAFKAHVGITTVDHAVVNTGTLALSAGPGRPRSVSLLPSVHLALVRESQLVDRIGIASEPMAERAHRRRRFISSPARAERATSRTTSPSACTDPPR